MLMIDLSVLYHPLEYYVELNAYVQIKDYVIFEPCHEIMVLFILRKLILQRYTGSHPVLAYWVTVIASCPFWLLIYNEGPLCGV